MDSPRPLRLRWNLPALIAASLGSVLGPSAIRAGDGARTVVVRVTPDDLAGHEAVVEKTVAVSRGDTLEVKLGWQATGYLWKMTRNDPGALKRQGEGPPEREQNRPGTPEYRVYRFKALKTGELEFERARPFGDRRVDATVRLKVTVKG